MLKQISKLINENEQEYYMKFSYNIALTYLSKKYGDKFQQNKNLSPENLAIDIISNLFSKDNTGKIHLLNLINKHSNEILEEQDYEFYIIKTIWKNIDMAISYKTSK